LPVGDRDLGDIERRALAGNELKRGGERAGLDTPGAERTDQGASQNESCSEKPSRIQAGALSGLHLGNIPKRKNQTESGASRAHHQNRGRNREVCGGCGAEESLAPFQNKDADERGQADERNGTNRHRYARSHTSMVDKNHEISAVVLRVLVIAEIFVELHGYAQREQKVEVGQETAKRSSRGRRKRAVVPSAGRVNADGGECNQQQHRARHIPRHVKLIGRHQCNPEYVRFASRAVRYQSAGLEQSQHAQKEETRMPSAIEPLPRQAYQRNKQQHGKNRCPIGGEPTHEEAEGGGGDGGQVAEHLECSSEFGR